MGLISTSLVQTVNKQITGTQGGSTTTSNVQSKTPTTTPQSSSAVTSAIKSVTGAVSSVEKEAASLISSGEKYVESWISSGAHAFQSVFSGADTSLAKGINGLFGDTFKDTSTTASTTIKTDVSDPMKTLAETSNPNTSAFKLTTGTGTPVQVATNGTTSLAGSSSTLTSTQVDTLRNRFNLDDLSGLSKTISDGVKSSGLSSVYSDLSGGLSSVQSGVTDAVSGAKGVTTGIISDATNVVQDVEGTVGSWLGGLLGTPVTGLSSIIGTGSSGTTFTAVDSENTALSTTADSVSADWVNEIIAKAKSLGCTDLSQYYSDIVNSAFARSLMSLVSSAGLKELLEQLISCDSFSGAKDDTTLASIATSLGGSHPAVTNVLLGSMRNPSIVNTGTYTTDVLTTPSLTKNDIPDLTTLFSTINVDPKTVYSGSDTTAGLPTYDLTAMSNTNTDVLNSAFGSTLFSDVLTGTPDPIGVNGTLSA